MQLNKLGEYLWIALAFFRSVVGNDYIALVVPEQDAKDDCARDKKYKIICEGLY